MGKEKILVIVTALLSILLCIIGTFVFLSSGKQPANLITNDTPDIFPDAQDSSATPPDNTAATKPKVPPVTSKTTLNATDTASATDRYSQLSEETMARVLEKATSLEYENEYILVDTDLYTMYVISHAQFFTVVLKQFPYRDGQVAAEKYLLDLLGVTPAELCNLNVDIFAPPEFDPSLTTDLGLSECLGPRTPENR